MKEGRKCQFNVEILSARIPVNRLGFRRKCFQKRQYAIHNFAQSAGTRQGQLVQGVQSFQIREQDRLQDACWKGWQYCLPLSGH